MTVTTFGHGSHRCPAQRFSVSAIVRTLAQLLNNFDLTAGFDEIVPLPAQIGGVARSARPVPRLLSASGACNDVSRKVLTVSGFCGRASRALTLSRL